MTCALQTVDHSFLTAATRAVFPLRLNAFESYMYLDARLGNSMSFYIDVDVEGTFDREALKQAIAFATARHPLLQATIISGRWGKKYWSLDANAEPQILWKTSEQTPAAWTAPADLTREAGVRILVEQRESDATICMQFQHACCDGAGALQWVEDWMVWYARLTGDPAVAPTPVEIQPDRLLDRRRRRLDTITGWRWITKGAWEIYKFFCQSPQPLRLPERPPSAAPTRRVPFISHPFTFEESQQLRRAANEQGATLNECLIRALFATIADWNADHGQPSNRNPWYRVNMPTSIRERADFATPAANLVSMTFFNRRHRAARDENDDLLADVKRESEEIKRTRRGTLFLDGVAIVNALPGLLPVILRVPWCMSTAVLTNVGDPRRRFTARFAHRSDKFVLGNLTVNNISGVPPLRPHTHAAIGVSSYMGCMVLGLQMTPELFSPTDAQRFLDLYVHHIATPRS